MSGSDGSGAARKFLTKMARRKFVIISQENSGVFSKILNEVYCTISTGN